jgi:hypothetical protein
MGISSGTVAGSRGYRCKQRFANRVLRARRPAGITAAGHEVIETASDVQKRM